MTDRADSAADSPIAAVVAGLLLPVAIYLAFWRIDWGTDSDSLLRIVLPVAFCIAAPSIVGSVLAAAVQAVRGDG